MLKTALFYSGAIAVLGFVACSGGSELVGENADTPPASAQRQGAGQIGSLKAALVDGGVVDGGAADGGDATSDL